MWGIMGTVSILQIKAGTASQRTTSCSTWQSVAGLITQKVVYENASRTNERHKIMEVKAKRIEKRWIT